MRLSFFFQKKYRHFVLEIKMHAKLVGSLVSFKFYIEALVFAQVSIASAFQYSNQWPIEIFIFVLLTAIFKKNHNNIFRCQYF